MRISIRWRLTLWNALGVAAVLIGFAGLVYLLVERSFRQQAERTADSGFRLVETDPRMAADPERRVAYWVREFDEHMGVFAAAFREDGSLMAAHPSVEDRRPSSSSSPVRRLETDADGYRWQVAEQLIHPGGHPIRFMLFIPLHHQEKDLAALAWAMIMAIPVALLASAGLAYVLARTALAPVDQLRERAERISAERLNERLPVPNPGDELGQLAATINAMIARLEQSFNEVKRFTADASHELRTPLTALRTEAEVALSGSPSVEEYRALVESILEECGRMTRLTDQLLMLAREDAGLAQLQREPVDLGRLAGDVVELLRPLAEAKGVALVLERTAPAWVSGDALRLRQVAMNLVDNALKFTPSGGTVRVGVERAGDAVRLTVADTGVGIAPEHIPRIFDRFYRIDKARSREMGGTGLGLSIVKSVVAAHGGAVTVSSQLQEGTTCVVELPAGTHPEAG